MEKKNYVFVIVGVLLVIGIGISFAYYSSKILSSGTGSSTEGQTVTLEDTTIVTEGKLEFNDLDIYPGHQNVSSIKVTATGDKNVLYNLIWTGTNTLNTPLNYKVYKTTTEQNPSVTCTKKEEGSLQKILYEECVQNNFTNLGEPISEGSITKADTSTKFKLVNNEELQATKAGNTVYYYVVLEFPNLEESQNLDMNGSFSGIVNIELLETKETVKDIILAGKTIDTERSKGISEMLTANTTGTIYEGEDDDGKTYYFAGDVQDNYVRFGGYYWRIVRVNGDGSLRLIYDGTMGHANGETGENTMDTLVGVSPFNENYDDNAYVGYMYGTPGSTTYEATHTNANSSTIKTYLENWYQTNLETKGFGSYIDTNAGFCGDREMTEAPWEGMETADRGYGKQVTAYDPMKRYLEVTGTQRPVMNPIFKCTNKTRDLYTVASSNKGNKSISKPIGLLTSDELVFAGASLDFMNGNGNTNYYLYIGEVPTWTMSPSYFGGGRAFEFVEYGGFAIPDIGYVYGGYGVRPVINLKSDSLISQGTGTIDNPFVVGPITSGTGYSGN